MAQLSANDTSVLSAIFDPEASPSNAVKVDASSVNALPNLSPSESSRLEKEHTAILAPLAKAEPKADEVSSVAAALSAFISTNPTYGPAYVDRAQLTRLSIATQDLFTAPSEPSFRSLFSDLQQGITLTTPPSPVDSVSPLQSRTLAAAHTHRGLLLLRIADLVSKDKKAIGAPAEVTSLSADEIEALASQDFTLGGRYGNAVARGLAVKTNPYARMCGAIVKEAMREEMSTMEATGGFVTNARGTD